MATAFDEDKYAWVNAAAIANSSVANATAAGSAYDQTVAQTSVALVNDLKTKLNLVLAALRDANIIAGD